MKPLSLVYSFTKLFSLVKKIQKGVISSTSSERSQDIKVECLKHQKKWHLWKKNKSLIATWEDLDNNSSSSSSSHNEQPNIFLMVNINDKVKIKSCVEFDSSSYSSSYEEDITYGVLLQSSCMISLQCKNTKKNINKLFVKMSH